MKRKIAIVGGTRPNFMKIAPLLHEMDEGFDIVLVHTGQHYDKEMSDIFFQELNIRPPDYNLHVGSGTHAEITGKVMMGMEKILIKEKPELVVVVGDVDSTLGAALAARKLNIPIAHVEAGLRSFNMKMPEEVNRVVVDHISDLLLVSEENGVYNLINEGIKKNIFLVGNVMIDTLFESLKKCDENKILNQYKVKPQGYILLTLHRKENVDYKENLQRALGIIQHVADKYPVIWPLHPRTKKRLKEFNMEIHHPRIRIFPPLGYLEMIVLEKNAFMVMTDSGGVQEETSALNVPCVTLRNETERPLTLIKGTNTITGLDEDKIFQVIQTIEKGNYKQKKEYVLWDGKAAKRINNAIQQFLASLSQ